MNTLLPRRISLHIRYRVLFAALLLPGFAPAANQTWDGGSTLDGNWSTITNWAGDTAAPGSAGDFSTDVATFNAAIANGWGLSGTPITLDAGGRFLGGVTFTGAAGDYTIGSTAGGALKVQGGGAIQILNSLTATNAIETINAPLSFVYTFNATYTLANNSASGSGAGAGTLILAGAVSHNAGGTATLTLSGSNTNANTVSGNITGAINLAKTGAGSWTLSGTNNYGDTGFTRIYGGTLKAGVATTGNNGAFGYNSTVTLANVAGVLLDLDGFATTIANLGGGGSNGGNVSLGSATLTLNGTSTALPFAGVISGAGGLTRAGSSTTTLAGANTYTGTTTISSGASLQLGNGGTTGSLAAASAINNNGTLAFNRSNATTQGTDFASTISGAGAVIQNGPGTLTLNGTNTYSGRTTVSGGSLKLAFGPVSSNIIASSSALTLGGGTLQLSGTGTQTFNGLTTTGYTGSRIIMGANQTLALGALTSAGGASALNFNTAAGGANGATVGSGLVVLTGQTAGNAINAGFTVTDSSGFGLATVNASNQVIRLTSTALLPTSGAASGTNYRIDNNNGGTTAAGSSNLAITASQSANSITVDSTAGSGMATLDSGVVLSTNTWNFGGSGSSTNPWQISGSSGGAGITSAGASNEIHINNYSDGTVTLNAPILSNGTNHVYHKGNGTTVFAGTNTYTGQTLVRGGTLEVVTGGSISNNSEIKVGDASGNKGILTLSGGSITSGGANVANSAGSSGTVNISAGSWGNTGEFYLGNNGSGVLNLSGSGSISATGGYYVGSSAGSSGVANVSGGTMSVGALFVGRGGTGVLNLSGGSVTGNEANTGTSFGSSGTANVSGGSWTSSVFHLGAAGTGLLNLTGGSITSTAGAYFAYSPGGSGTANVSGGAWTTSSGTEFQVGRFGKGEINLSDSGIINVGGTSGTGTVSLAMYASEAIGTLNIGGAMVGAAAAGTLNAASVNGGSGTATVNFNQNNATYTFAPTITGTTKVNQNSSGTTILNGTNTYTGATTISAGTLKVGAAGKLGNGNYTGAITNDGALQYSSSSAQKLSGTITGSGTLIKDTSSSTLTVSGSNSYSGGTTVSAGTLNVTNTSGSATGSGNVTVDAGATLSGTGIITTGSGNYLFVNGKLQVGDSTLGTPVASQLQISTSGGGSTVLGAGSSMYFDLFSGAGLGDRTGILNASDRISLYGDLVPTLGSLVLVNPNSLSGFKIGDKWKIFDLNSGAGSITGGFAGIDYSALNLSNGLFASFDRFTGELAIAVPEPSRALLFLLGIQALITRRRRWQIVR